MIFITNQGISSNELLSTSIGRFSQFKGENQVHLCTIINQNKIISCLKKEN